MGLLDDVFNSIGDVVGDVISSPVAGIALDAVTGDPGAGDLLDITPSIDVPDATDLAMSDVATTLGAPDITDLAMSDVVGSGTTAPPLSTIPGAAHSVVGSSGLPGITGLGNTIPDFGPITGQGSIAAAGGTTAMATVPATIGGIGSSLASIIQALYVRLGGTAAFTTMGSFAARGKVIWQALSAWAAKNPSVSLVSMLVSLGLTAEQAAQFIGWGATKGRRRRRRGGVSGRDIRTTRRTIRKIDRMYHLIHRGGSHHRSSRGRVPAQFVRQG